MALKAAGRKAVWVRVPPRARCFFCISLVTGLQPSLASPLRLGFPPSASRAARVATSAAASAWTRAHRPRPRAPNGSLAPRSSASGLRGSRAAPGTRALAPASAAMNAPARLLSTSARAARSDASGRRCSDKRAAIAHRAAAIDRECPRCSAPQTLRRPLSSCSVRSCTVHLPSERMSPKQARARRP